LLFESPSISKLQQFVISGPKPLQTVLIPKIDSINNEYIRELTTSFAALNFNNNNNQAFYSQASWGRIEMKPHEQKKQGQNKSKKEGGKQ
jgi:hypothetical protein